MMRFVMSEKLMSGDELDKVCRVEESIPHRD